MLNGGGLRLLSDPIDLNASNWPPGLVGPFLPMAQNDISIFNDILSDEIDSDFASSIGCCDACYDGFKSHWPGVTFRDSEFQTQSMEIFWLVDNTRVKDLYSNAELSTLRRFVVCARCDEHIKNYVWIYEHRFGNSAELEDEIDELKVIGAQTPFLLLEHHLARRVLEQIRNSGAAPSFARAGLVLYRARLAGDVASLGQSPRMLSTYGPPPAEFVGEGRFNHAATPMLYLASTAEVAAAEISQPGVACHVAELRLTVDLALLDLVNLDEAAPGFELMQALANSALIASPRVGSGWLKQQYIFSRFVADCARSSGFDAIRYGSTKKAEGDNLVVLVPPPETANLAALVSVQDLEGHPPDYRY